MSPSMLLVAAAVGQPAPPPVTFAEHIAPIVYTQCAGCHRPGQAAPFPLQIRPHDRAYSSVVFGPGAPCAGTALLAASRALRASWRSQRWRPIRVWR